MHTAQGDGGFGSRGGKGSIQTKPTCARRRYTDQGVDSTANPNVPHRGVVPQVWSVLLTKRSGSCRTRVFFLGFSVAWGLCLVWLFFCMGREQCKHREVQWWRGGWAKPVGRSLPRHQHLTGSPVTLLDKAHMGQEQCFYGRVLWMSLRR